MGAGQLKIGCCTNMIAAGPDGTGAESIKILAEAGYEYIEMPLAQVTRLTEKEFRSLKGVLDSNGIRCEACNIFFPPDIRLTGDRVNSRRVCAYMDRAFDRAVQMGTEIIVFGSSGARNVPEGFSREKAWRQLVSLLREVDGKAGDCGITVAIEPINRLESNIVNLTMDGFKLMQEVGLPNIKLLIDYYHMAAEREEPGIISRVGACVRHVHFSEYEGRVFPREENKPEYLEFFRQLEDINYDSRISVEAYSSSLKQDAGRSLAVIRKYCRKGDKSK